MVAVLWVCNGCGTKRAVGLYHCPHCGRVRHTDEGEGDMPKITRTQGPTVQGDELTPEARAMRERAEASNEASADSDRARLDSDEAGRGETERQDREAKADAANAATEREHERENADSEPGAQEEGAESSPGNSSPPSPEKPKTSPTKSTAKSRQPARATENPSDEGRTGRSSASSTGGASTGKGE